MVRPLYRRLAELVGGDTLRGRLIRGGVGVFAVRIGGLLMALASSVVLARTLGTESYGAYAVALSIIMIVGIPVHVGLPTLVLRETASSAANEDLARMKGIWLWATRSVLLMSAVVSLVALAVIWLWPGSLRPEVLIALLLVPGIALGSIRGAAMRGLHRVVMGSLTEALIRPGLFVLLVLLSGLFWITPLTAADAMTLHVMASAAALALGTILLLRCRPPGMAAVPADTSQARDWRRALWPMAMVGGLHVVNQNAGVLVLGAVSTEAEVAMFRVALSASVLVLIGLQLATPQFEPHFVRLHQAGDRIGLQRMATASAQAGFLMTLPVAALFILGGEWLLRLLYGDAYAGAYGPLAVLASGQIVRAYFGSSETILMLSGHERAGAFIWIAGTLFGLLSSFALSSIYGPIGAALAATSLMVLVRMAQWSFLRKEMRIDTAVHSAWTGR